MVHFHFFHQHIWIRALHKNASLKIARHLSHFMSKKSLSPVYICIGTPLFKNDILGPLTGSLLKALKIPYVYGTLDAPIHGLNINSICKYIKCIHKHRPIIAIDMSWNTSSLSGFVTLRKGSLKPGSALNKKIKPIGDIEITGTTDPNCYTGDLSYFILSLIIAKGIFIFSQNNTSI